MEFPLSTDFGLGQPFFNKVQYLLLLQSEIVNTFWKIC
jgi:hypothetical protein